MKFEQFLKCLAAFVAFNLSLSCCGCLSRRMSLGPYQFKWATTSHRPILSSIVVGQPTLQICRIANVVPPGRQAAKNVYEIRLFHGIEPALPRRRRGVLATRRWGHYFFFAFGADFAFAFGEGLGFAFAGDFSVVALFTLGDSGSGSAGSS